MKQTAYFRAIRERPDRATIKDEWLLRALYQPARQERQRDGRIRHWVRIPEAGGRWLRVVLLPDGETVHNAFFDRRFRP